MIFSNEIFLLEDAKLSGRSSTEKEEKSIQEDGSGTLIDSHRRWLNQNATSHM